MRQLVDPFWILLGSLRFPAVRLGSAFGLAAELPATKKREEPVAQVA